MNWKTIIVIFISLLIFVPFIVSANLAPEADWTVSLGGNRQEIIYDIIQTSDGGYIAAGMTASKSSSDDVYVVKLNQTGGVEWENNYGDIKKDYAKSIRQTSDGGYIIGGGTRSFNVGVIDYYIIKLDPSGGVQWEKTYGGSQTDMCEAIIQTKDGGYMAAGQSWENILEGNVYLIKLDPNGNKEWDKTIGGGLEDGAYDIQQTPDRGYIVAGHTRSIDGSYKVYIVKTDSDGNVEWSRDFGGGTDNKAFSLEQHRDGYVAAGYTKSHGESSDVYVVKVDLDGNLVWEKTFGGRGTEEVAQSIGKTSDGGYILAGKTNQYTYGSYDMYLLKLDSNGNEQWSQVFGGENDDFGYCAIQNSKGGFTVAGQTKSTRFGSSGSGGDVFIIKTKDPLGGKTSSGTSGPGDIPEYGSPSPGVVFGFLMLVTAGLLIRRRS